MKIDFIATEVGDATLTKLQNDGWKVVDQYAQMAFDKGIDYDEYTLKKGDETLYFEWTNWFEWEVTGSQPVLEMLTEHFGLVRRVR